MQFGGGDAMEVNAFKLTMDSQYGYQFTAQDKEAIEQLIKSPSIQEFLENDRCCMVADSYLVAMALVYMKRANYEPMQYTYVNFMVALHLAHETCEDDIDLRSDIIRKLFNNSPDAPIEPHHKKFVVERRTKLWTELKYKVLVSRDECESLMKSVLVGNYIWRRLRPASHGEVAVRNYIKEEVYFSQRFWTNGHSFRCLICESFSQIREWTGIEALARTMLNSGQFVYQNGLFNYQQPPMQYSWQPSQHCRVNALPQPAMTYHQYHQPSATYHY